MRDALNISPEAWGWKRTGANAGDDLFARIRTRLS
jgi:hypothetical protein